ncbi:MAG: iron chelate uptake ABC transporter family permease subunit [Firmicutes bacterium]|nr:iron chelate uptake ABC transporter family permease subunit [Bacillota bacterium]
MDGQLANKITGYGGKEAGEPVSSFVKARRRRGQLVIALLLLILLLTLGTGVILGAVKIRLSHLVRALRLWPDSGLPVDDSTKAIIIELRLPRALLAAMVGAALALAGACFQALFLNPMADPYILGASAGAALGATLAFLFPVDQLPFGIGLVPLAAFTGAAVTVLLVSRLARSGNYISLYGMLLSGLAVSAFFSALVSLLMYFSHQRLQQIVFWLMGGLGRANWLYVRTSLPYFIVGAAVVQIQARALNVLLLGEETAASLGVEVERTKRWLFLGASLLTATAVAVSGPIGFVGLIVPHVLRMLVGTDHRLLLPASALGGGILVVAADTLARTVIAPTELPVGLIMALGGAPFFLSLLKRRPPL